MLRRTANGRPVLRHQTVGDCLLCPAAAAAAAADAHWLGAPSASVFRLFDRCAVVFELSRALLSVLRLLVGRDFFMMVLSVALIYIHVPISFRKREEKKLVLRSL